MALLRRSAQRPRSATRPSGSTTSAATLTRTSVAAPGDQPVSSSPRATAPDSPNDSELTRAKVSPADSREADAPGPETGAS